MKHHSNQFPAIERPEVYPTIARFPSRCKCGNRIKVGDSIYYDRTTKKAICFNCGES